MEYTTKKPPDKYRTVKCPLNSIIKDELNQSILFDACFRTHQIVIHTYQLLRLWILDKYHNNKSIPIITIDTIKMAFKALLKKSKGNTPKNNNELLYKEFLELYETTYKHLNYDIKLDGLHLSHILNCMAVDMVTNIENNIKMNFFSYIRRFVNSYFKEHNNILLENCEKGTKTNLRKQLNKELYEIKEDLINNTLKSNNKYHEWILEHRKFIFPSTYTYSSEFDITNNPQNYLPGMIYMCLLLEKVNAKSFQFFPLRTDAKMKYIPIDTTILVDLFITSEHNKYYSDISGYKDFIWDTYFKLDETIFKQKNYNFDYRISTDCFAVSIQLINKNYIESEINKKYNMKNKRANIKNETINMNSLEKEQYRKDIKEKSKVEKEEYKLKIKQQKDIEKEKFNKLSKEEKKEVIKQQKLQKEKDKLTNNKIEYIEFPYLEQLTDKEYTNLKTANWVCIDPGKKTLLYMKNNKGTKYRYTNRKYITQIKRLKYQKLLKNYKDKNNITQIENELCNYNSKSCNLEKFKEFIKKKNELNILLLESYKKDIFRKYKWYSYINKKHAETNLVREIKTTFGKDVKLIMGDWSDRLKKSPCKLKYISTPNVSLKRKLKEHFTIYNLDEFRTSCLNYKTEERCKNIYLPDKKKIYRKIHSVLTFQTESNRLGCINRDENAVNNMIKIVNSYLVDKTRPEKFRRDYKVL